eukprot:TRINITY_DN17573_c0_g1_i3.p1 TRINITY_DN17573_c0_g1~~TRINITY_DN17573_c0_g1_i3.p1  ORF type:complete len:607 (+),score=136.86 TRINITY_DN17573_c0_g1_i3:418-2238(+)
MPSTADPSASSAVVEDLDIDPDEAELMQSVMQPNSKHSGNYGNLSGQLQMPSRLKSPNAELDNFKLVAKEMGFSNEAQMEFAFDSSSGNAERALNYLLTSKSDEKIPDLKVSDQDLSIHMIKEMGFLDERAISQALHDANGDLNTAVAILSTTEAPMDQAGIEEDLFSSGGSKLESLLGSQLMRQSEKVPSKSLSDLDVIGLYFGGSWCPPCRAFLPQLIQFYNRITQEKGHKFELVFISSDQSHTDFAQYYAQMPFLAIPFENRRQKDMLSATYAVRAIPTLIMIDAKSTELICIDAANQIRRDDPLGQKFPWRKPTLRDNLGKDFLKNDGTQITNEALSNKIVMLFFSSKQMDPDGQALQRLKVFYEAHHDEKEFEVVFVSRDAGDDSFKKYIASMPWCILPMFKAATVRSALLTNLKLNTSKAPNLVVMSKDFKNIYTTAGMLKIQADPDAENFPWTSAASVNKMIGMNIQVLLKLREPAVFLFADHVEDDRQRITLVSRFRAVGDRFCQRNRNASSGMMSNLQFFYVMPVKAQDKADPDSEAKASKGNAEFKFKDKSLYFVIFDVQARKMHKSSLGEDASEADMEGVISRFISRKVEMVPFL